MKKTENEMPYVRSSTSIQAWSQEILILQGITGPQWRG